MSAFHPQRTLAVGLRLPESRHPFIPLSYNPCGRWATSGTDGKTSFRLASSALCSRTIVCARALRSVSDNWERGRNPVRCGQKKPRRLATDGVILVSLSGERRLAAPTLDGVLGTIGCGADVAANPANGIACSKAERSPDQRHRHKLTNHGSSPFEYSKMTLARS